MNECAMYATDRQTDRQTDVRQTDVRSASSINGPSAGHNKNSHVTDVKDEVGEIASTVRCTECGRYQFSGCVVWSV